MGTREHGNNIKKCPYVSKQLKRDLITPKWVYVSIQNII